MKVIALRSATIAKVKSISKVLFESLDYNLLSVSQLYETSYNCLFTDKGVTAFRRSDGSFPSKMS
jgi:hypothetical protein